MGCAVGFPAAPNPCTFKKFIGLRAGSSADSRVLKYRSTTGSAWHRRRGKSRPTVNASFIYIFRLHGREFSSIRVAFQVVKDIFEGWRFRFICRYLGTCNRRRLTFRLQGAANSERLSLVGRGFRRFLSCTVRSRE